MDTEKSIIVLNSFISINNARIQRYKEAAKDTEESHLKKVFSNFQVTSEKIKTELKKEIIKLGGNPVENQTNKRYFYSIWFNLKNIFVYKDLDDVIYSSERNETIVIQSYYEAIYNNFESLSTKQQIMLNEQYLLINVDYAKMKSYKRAI
ncbi:DUF2383 domain-containing protein [Flavobacterium sp. Arc3]|jgi:uncharacterized protein (TIGR02284 family)|uniref:DUF2383 domain-containing protein n=1 Tax=unclassified Flavobacterium TaxID=196869 RepID=UPI00352EC8AE